MGRWWAIDPALQCASPYMAMGNNPMTMIDADGRTWGVFKAMGQAWDYTWDKGNQFARWADENGIPSFNVGVGMNSGGQVNPIVNGQNINENNSINQGVANAGNSLTSQLANLPIDNSSYRPLNRGWIPCISVDPVKLNGILGENSSSHTSSFNWYDNLNLGKLVWNHPLTRVAIPDFISIGAGFSAIFPFGGSSSVEAQWITRGPQASFYPAITATQGIGVGYSIDATLNIGGTNYIGNANDIRRDMLLSNIGEGDIPTGFVSIGATAGAKIGATATLGKTANGYIVGKTINLGVGLPAGPIPVNGAIGISNTWMIYDFYKN